MKTIFVALVLTVVGCDKADSKSNGMTQAMDVRLLGINAPGSVLVRLAGVTMTVDGQPLPDVLNEKELDLGQLNQAWSAATFSLPADAQKVALDLQFQRLGSVMRNGKSQVLDLSGPPLSVTADAALMRPRSKVVLQIDLAQSLVDQGDQVFLLPDFIVLY